MIIECPNGLKGFRSPFSGDISDEDICKAVSGVQTDYQLEGEQRALAQKELAELLGYTRVGMSRENQREYARRMTGIYSARPVEMDEGVQNLMKWFSVGAPDTDDSPDGYLTPVFYELTDDYNGMGNTVKHFGHMGLDWPESGILLLDKWPLNQFDIARKQRDLAKAGYEIVAKHSFNQLLL